MLRICTEQEYEKYAGFVYELALDQTKSGYPTYCDGIKTKEMFMERARKAFLSDTECILLALNAAKELGGKYMTFFCDEEGEETVMKLGFKCVGGYVCYKKILM